MKIFVATSKKYARSVINVITSLIPRPFVLIASFDDEVEVLAKMYGFEFTKIKDIEKLYTIEKLEEFDVALASLDDDVYNLGIARVAKSMGIPLVITFIHNSLNKDELAKEGVTSVVNLDNFISSMLKLFLLPDTWIVLNLIPMLNIVVALYRVVKRGLLGVSLNVFYEAIDGENVKVFAIDKTGNFISGDKPLENGDILFVIGLEGKVMKTVVEFEKIFRRYEQQYTMRYTDMQRLTGYG